MSCVGTPPVVFVPSDWKTRYPEFTGVSDAAAQLYFDEATLYCANRLNPVRTVAALTMLLYMVTAHIAALNSPTTSSGSDPLTPPGRVASATEGSVSATFSVGSGPEPGSKGWFTQTKYGFAFWQASLAYRLFQYVPGRTFGRASLAQVPWVYPNGS